MSDSRLREEICRFGRSLHARGLSPGASGNLSARTADGGWLMTPTNHSLGDLDPAQLSRLDATGRRVEGPPPTKERPLHAALYETRPFEGAVAHLHCLHCVAASMLVEPDAEDVFPPLTPYYLMRVGKTALVPYHDPGDPAVADAIRGLAGRYSSVLLANHGPVVCGATLESAVWAIEELEATAALHLLTRAAGPRLVPPDAIERLRKRDPA